jgi:hypothetical protein
MDPVTGASVSAYLTPEGNTMKKARFVFSVLLVSLTLTGCSTSLTAPDDCDPDVEDCVKPTGGN